MSHHGHGQEEAPLALCPWERWAPAPCWGGACRPRDRLDPPIVPSSPSHRSGSWCDRGGYRPAGALPSGPRGTAEDRGGGHAAAPAVLSASPEEDQAGPFWGQPRDTGLRPPPRLSADHCVVPSELSTGLLPGVILSQLSTASQAAAAPPALKIRAHLHLTSPSSL